MDAAAELSHRADAPLPPEYLAEPNVVRADCKIQWLTRSSSCPSRAAQVSVGADRADSTPHRL